MFSFIKKKTGGGGKNSRGLHKMIIHDPAPIKRDLLIARGIYVFLLNPMVQAAACAAGAAGGLSAGALIPHGDAPVVRELRW